MAVTLGPAYVTSGLICYLNAGNTASYPGSGSTWTDLSGNGAHFTMQGTLTWSSTTGFSGFDGNTLGTGNKFYAATPSKFYNLKTSQGGNGYTVCVIARSTGGGGAWRKLIANTDGENYIDLYQQSASPYGWHQDGSGETLYVNDFGVASDTFPMNDSVWRMYSATNSNSGTVTNPSSALTLGNEPGSSNIYPWIGNIGIVLIYNRVLSAAELVRNYNVFIKNNTVNFSGDYGIVYNDGTSNGQSNQDMGGLINVAQFKSSGTWTKPPGCTKVIVKVVGGGGGAAGYCESGGAGGYAEALVDVTAVSTVSVTVGGGGAGTGYYGGASNGSSSSFGSYCSASGGYGANQNYSHSGGVGGTGSGGQVNLQGGAGMGHVNSIGHWGGRGGQSYFGGSGAMVRNHSNLGSGITATVGHGSPGAGGPGQITNGGGYHNIGGPGEAGLVLVYAYM